MNEVGVHAMVNVSQSALSTGKPARRHGNAHPTIVPYQTFAAADGLLVLAVGNDGQWARVCEAMGEPERARDPRLVTNPGRLEHRAEVVAWLGGRIGAETVATWSERFRRFGVPAGPVREMLDAVRDPVLVERGMVGTYAFPGGGETALFSLPWLADGARAPVRRVPPTLGEHTAEFLAEYGE